MEEIKEIFDWKEGKWKEANREEWYATPATRSRRTRKVNGG